MQVVVGRVVRPHGVRGEVVVSPHTDRPAERFTPGARLGRASGPGLVVRSARPHADRWLLRLVGVTTREQADALRGVELTIDAEADPPPEPDEYHDRVLIGAQVLLRDGTVVGTVVAVEHGPMQDLLVVAADSGREVRIPFVRAIVPTVDAVVGGVVIDPPEGLLDDEGGTDAPRRRDHLS